MLLGPMSVLRAVVLLLVAAPTSVSGAQLGPPGVPSGIHGKLVSASDYQLNLHPPEEDTQDALDALDSTMALEEVKRKAEEDDYAAAKQQMLNAEKGQIRSMQPPWKFPPW